MEYEPTGLHYEDFRVGQRWRTPGRTVTEADLVLFAGLSGDSTYLHTDAELAARTPFGARIAHGHLVLALASGLLVRLGILEGTVEALLGVEWRFLAPVYAGDTLAAEVEVREKRPSKRGKGLVRFAIECRNQRGEKVGEGTQLLMLARAT